MKKGIHPQYYHRAVIECACGTRYVVGSTREFMRVEVCANCHPFFSGKGGIVESIGAIGKFKQRLEKIKQVQKERGINTEQEKE